MRKIVTSYWRKPIPTDKYDWEAWYDGDEVVGGFGRTEAEAIQDLKDNTDDEEVDAEAAAWVASIGELVSGRTAA